MDRDIIWEKTAMIAYHHSIKQLNRRDDPMGRILILSNKGELANHVRNMNHNVIATSFDNAAETLHTKKPDLVLVDLAHHTGTTETWRQIWMDVMDSRTPAMVVIPRDRMREVELLNGIHDFILYPYDARELEMRIKLILSRREADVDEEVIKVGNLAINPARYEVTVDGWSVDLTLKEYELLKYLATHKGRVFTREILLDQIWGYDYYGGTRTVDVHIGRLRTKIETGKYSFIRTVRGVGYIFTDEY